MYFLIVLNTVYTINMHVSSHCSSLPFTSAYLTLSSSNLIIFPFYPFVCGPAAVPPFFFSPPAAAAIEKLGVGSPASNYPIDCAAELPPLPPPSSLLC